MPTVWLMLQRHMEANDLRLPDLKRLTIGGAAPPPAMIEAFERMGIPASQGWGMTEMSPIGSIGTLKPPFENLVGKDKIDRLSSQGFAPFMVEMNITDDAGNKLPRDGKTFGRLKVRGAAISKAYYRVAEDILDDEGFFDTGDVATLDQHAYMRITDRSKDVIKSGGEWISSIDLENLAVGHPDVLEAAVIGIHHPKWDERPLLIVQLKPDSKTRGPDILHYMEGKIAKWWMPDDVVFVDAIPHTATGKIKKTELREQFKGYRLPRT